MSNETKDVGLSENEMEVLENARGTSDWLRPMDFGGYDGSHHSRTAARLVRRGFMEREERQSVARIRPVFLYRITAAGDAAIRATQDASLATEGAKE